jgi:hypothetical protein
MESRRAVLPPKERDEEVEHHQPGKKSLWGASKEVVLGAFGAKTPSSVT